MKPERHHDSKTRLLDAALGAVRTSGYAGTTVEDICRAAGVTKGSFFHHFKSKDELALAAVAHWDAVTEGLFASAAYHDLPDPLDRVLGYVALRAQLLTGAIADFTCFLGTLVQEIHASHPVLRAACDRSMRRHVAVLTTDLDAARTRYAPDAPWSAQSVGYYIQSVLQGAFIFAKAQQDTTVVHHDLGHLARHLIRLFNRVHSSSHQPGSPQTENPSMNTPKTTTRVDGNDLVLTRIIDATPEKVYEAWTRPELLKQWFVPKPWTITAAELDLRVGGASRIVMRGPDGTEFPSLGVYLEVVQNRRLVFTDAYTKAWEPSAKPFMTASVDLEDLGGKTRYTARARHWSKEDREAHEKMGFHEGWSICAEQLADLVEPRA